jgi:hypothetical protein
MHTHIIAVAMHTYIFIYFCHVLMLISRLYARDGITIIIHIRRRATTGVIILPIDRRRRRRRRYYIIYAKGTL